MEAKVSTFFIDLDGTVFRGNAIIEGADRAIAELRAARKKVAFVSNRGNMSRAQCLRKLHNMGVEANLHELLLASYMAARFINQYYPGAAVWTLGDDGLREEMRANGVYLCQRPEEADWLVISLHENLTYRDLNAAFQAVRHGARILATNMDRTYPDGDVLAIDVAGMVGAIESASGRRVEVVTGKPSFYMGNAVLDIVGEPPERCAIVGDSLESDIKFGKFHGMHTVLVLSGNAKAEHMEDGPLKPDFVIPSLADLPGLVRDRLM